jgi:anaerobic magnesium-protoporphyrin IX monomethyl ester cyclase
VSLVKALSTTGDLAPIPGLAYRDTQGNTVLTNLPAPPDLHRLPWPDRRGAPTECLGHRLAPLVASRGCYGHCDFCCISAWHEQTMPGKRFRLRPLDDVADEMAQLYHERKTEVFIFHDDNFFLPDRSRNLHRIHRLADMLEQRGVCEFATIIKARPNDLNPEILSVLQQRLGLIRLYVGIENASDAGLNTLGRGMTSDQNHYALELLERRGVFSCFNLLIFGPTTRIEDLETNLSFMEKFAAVPQNFCRVELYAGTPILARLQSEGLCNRDYLDTDYRIADAAVQRIFELAMQCLYVRNFSEEATSHRLMTARFSVEVAARFHPSVFRESWRGEAKRLGCVLTHDSVKAMREIIEFVGRGAPIRDEVEFVAALAGRLRAAERLIHNAADLLTTKVENAVCKTAQDDPEYSGFGGCHYGRRQSAQSAK